MKILLTFLILSSLSSAASQESYKCKDQKGRDVKLLIRSDDSFEISVLNTTTIFLKTDSLIDYVNNQTELIYRRDFKEWSEHPWFGYKTYTHIKSDVEFDKIEKSGFYENYIKLGLLSRADKDKIIFKCK